MRQFNLAPLHMSSARCEEFVIGTGNGLRRGERDPQPSADKQLRGLVPLRRRSWEAQGILAPLRVVQPRARRPGRGAFSSLGLWVRTRRPDLELGPRSIV